MQVRGQGHTVFASGEAAAIFSYLSQLVPSPLCVPSTLSMSMRRRREAKSLVKARPVNSEHPGMESKSLVEIMGSYKTKCGEDRRD